MLRNIHHIISQFVFRLVDTGGIQEYDLSLFQGQYRLDTVTGSLRFVGCDGDLLSDQSVHQSGLTYVGTSDQCGKAGFICRIFVHFLFLLFLSFSLTLFFLVSCRSVRLILCFLTHYFFGASDAALSFVLATFT